MTTAIPDLWPETLKPDVLSPVAILRTQAAKLSERTNGLLEADVVSSVVVDGEAQTRRYVLEITAPALGHRKFQVLAAEHSMTGAYPVKLHSDFLPEADSDTASSLVLFDSKSRECENQSSFQKYLAKTLSSQKLLTVLESLLAQINDQNN
jgi:hypothetical protein